MLSTIEQQRYQKQISLADVGHDGQLKLKNARVLCVGVGGLGSPLAQYLVSCGIGKLGLVDGDSVEASNLARQILFHPSDIGYSKSERAQKYLQSLNPECEIASYPFYLNADNAMEIFKHYDIIADCSDNFATRYLINDIALMLDKSYVYAAVFKHLGQLAVFNGKEHGCLRCAFDALDTTLAPTCDNSGILATHVGIVGVWQAHEIIKHCLSLTHCDETKLLSMNLLNNKIKSYSIDKNVDCICHHTNFDFKDISRPIFQKISHDRFIDHQKVNALLAKENALLIDLRESTECLPTSQPNAVNIPLSGIEEKMAQLKLYDYLILSCPSTSRSQYAYHLLAEQLSCNIYIGRALTP